MSCIGLPKWRLLIAQILLECIATNFIYTHMLTVVTVTVQSFVNVNWRKLEYSFAFNGITVNPRGVSVYFGSWITCIQIQEILSKQFCVSHGLWMSFFPFWKNTDIKLCPFDNVKTGFVRYFEIYTMKRLAHNYLQK